MINEISSVLLDSECISELPTDLQPLLKATGLETLVELGISTFQSGQVVPLQTALKKSLCGNRSLPDSDSPCFCELPV